MNRNPNNWICKFFFLLMILINISLFGQDFSVNAALLNNVIVIRSGDSVLFTNYKFNDAVEEWTDFDNDGVDELIIIDRNAASQYYLYAFVMIEKLKLADSLFCGSIEPFVGFSDEILEPVIFSGYPELEKYFEKEEEGFSAISCYQFDGEKIININDRLYSVFIEANEELFTILNTHFTNSNKDCLLASKQKGLLAAIYINYENAGENSLAKSFIERYYPCDDRNTFVELLNSNR